MDDNGHRENGRHKHQQGQWLMQHQPSMKQIMAIMAERDGAIQERNLAVSEKKTALAERDIAILQRDSAIAERNNAILERDNAIASLQYQDSSMNTTTSNISPCPSGCQIPRALKHMHHPHHMIESPYSPPKDIQIPEIVPISAVPLEPAKTRRMKRPREAKPGKKTTLKQSKKAKRDTEEQQHGRTNTDWKDQGLGLNQVAYDETTMPVPVCSCTGTLRPCYKWGNGGWQSACCTNSLSMYPLPAVPNKSHARIGGRKMSGSAFSKLLSRLAAEGHDLSIPVDLRLHWAKHGTNRYITIK